MREHRCKAALANDAPETEFDRTRRHGVGVWETYRCFGIVRAWLHGSAVVLYCVPRHFSHHFTLSYEQGIFLASALLAQAG